MVTRAREVLIACAASLGVMIVACSPNLKDGVYGCKTGACPDGFYCHSDERCYAAPESDASSGGSDGDTDAPDDAGGSGDAGDGGGGDAASADAGSDAGETGADAGGTDAGDLPTGDAGAPYEPCTDSATCRSGSTCLFGPDPAATNGYCSETCANDFTCPMLDGRPGLCLDGECFPGCSTPSECEGDYGCYSAATGAMMGVNVCLEIAGPEVAGTEACQLSGMPPMPVNCDTPAACLFHGMFDMDNGICSLHCETGGPVTTECPGNGVCVEVFVGVTHCLAPCTMQTDCGTGLICAPFGPGGNVCIPSGWSDESPPLPLPGPPM
jgi:hypothetical protein